LKGRKKSKRVNRQRRGRRGIPIQAQHDRKSHLCKYREGKKETTNIGAGPAFSPMETWKKRRGHGESVKNINRKKMGKLQGGGGRTRWSE